MSTQAANAPTPPQPTAEDLAAAIKNRELSLNYQPIVDMKTKTVIGFDPVADRQRFKVTDSGLVVISKGMKLHAAVDPSG